MPAGRQQRPSSAEAVSERFDAARRAVVIALLVLVPVAFWRPAADVFGLPKAALVWVGTVAVLALGVSKVAWTRRAALPWGALPGVAAAFVAAAVLATLTSSTPALSFFGEFERFTGLLNYACYTVLAFVVATTFGAVDVERALRWIVLASAVPLLYGLAQWADVDPWDWKGYDFVSTFGTFGGSNFYAGYAAIVLPIATYVAIDRSPPRWVRVVALVVVIEAVLATLASHSIQGPIAGGAGLAVVLAMLGYSRFGSVVPRRTLAGVAAGLVIIGVLVALGPLRSEIRDGLGERRYFWRAAVEMTSDDPVVGTGLDTFGQSWLAVRSPEHARRFGDSIAEAPHSVPLGMFSNGGLLLGLTYAAVLVASLAGLVRALRRAPRDRWLFVAAIGGAWLAYQVQAAVSMDLPAQALLHWFLIGSILAVVGAPTRIFALPGSAVRSVGRGRHRRQSVPTSTWAVVAVAAALSVIALIWIAAVPVKADVDAGTGYRTAATGNVDAGVDRLEQATDATAWRSRYWLLLTAVLENVQAYERALGAAEEAATREPGSSQYAVFAARLASQTNDLDGASRWYREAVRRDPHSYSVLTESTQWAAEHDRPWALGAAERVVRLYPSAGAWLQLGDLRAHDGDIAGARRAYREVLRLDRDHATAAARLASLAR